MAFLAEIKRRRVGKVAIAYGAVAWGVTMFTEEMPWLKGQDLEWVMGRGVCEWIGWRN